MSNLDVAPVEQNCHWRGQAQPMTRLLPARDVPLGGIRAMSVRRSLPQRDLPLVGAWCFLDQMGPERVDMRVLPHPHIGLQTVTWPLVGQVRHRFGGFRLASRARRRGVRCGRHRRNVPGFSCWHGSSVYVSSPPCPASLRTARPSMQG